jgi:UDP-N-acetyl-D-mannosaminuronic acid transferase (WecB/TagA/CpsF family)
MIYNMQAMPAAHAGHTTAGAWTVLHAAANPATVARIASAACKCPSASGVIRMQRRLLLLPAQLPLLQISR